MADRIKGITIELNGDTTGLSNALKGVNKEIRDTQSNLRDVNKLLKMDPGNTELLSQKQKYLTDAIDSTKKKLQEEKLALEQLKSAPQTEEKARQQETLTREIESTEQSLKSLESEYKTFGSVASQQLQVAGDKVKDVGSKVSSVGSVMTKGITVPVAAAAAASVTAWNEVDAALDTITQKTGASGDALADMQERAKNIAETIPTDFQTAGDAIGEVNTRFDLTGDALEELSTQFIEFAKLNDTDVSTSIDNVSSVLNAFNMSTDQAGGMLDVLNSVSQQTGLSVNTLSSDLATNAAQLKDMGLNATQSAQFLGSVEMSGLDVSTAMAGMKKAMKNASDQGLSLDDALKGFSTTMSSNASDTEKLQSAYDLFGSKAGAAIYNACATGKLSFDDFSSSMSDFSGNVENTFNETLDPLDQVTVVMNNLKDLGAEIVDSSGPMLVDLLTQVKDTVKGLKESWDGLSPGMQEAIIKAVMIAAVIGPILIVIGKVIGAVGTVISTVGSLVGFISATVIPAIAACSVPILPIIAIIAAVVAGVIAVIEIVKNWGAISEWFSGVWQSVCDTVQSFAQGLGDFFSGLWTDISTGISDTWEGIKQFFSDTWNDIGTTASDTWSGITDGLSDTWNTISTNASNTFDTVKTNIGNAMDSAKSFVGNALDNISNFFSGVKLELPHINLPHFSIQGSFSLDPPSIPHISVDWYKKAMDEAYILNEPTIFGMSGNQMLGGGEAGQEAVVGTEKLAEIVRNAVASISGGTTIIPVYIGQDRIEEIVVKATQRSNYRSGGR
jgi:phage-related minor tail protein